MASRSTPTSRRLVALAAAVVAMQLAGCGDDTESPDAAGSIGPPAGSPIVEGIDVPPGTTLVGDVFAHRVPAYDSPTVPSITPSGPMGFEPPATAGETAPPSRGMSVGGPAQSTPAYVETTAVLVVIGDPVEAFASLIEQAEVAGIEMLTLAPDDEPAFCVVTDVGDSGDVSGRYALDDDLPDSDLALSCNGTGRSSVDGGTQRELALNLFVRERDDPFDSFVALTLREYEVGGEPITPNPWEVDLYQAAPVPEGPSPVKPPPLPGPGEPGDPLSDDWEWGYNGADYEVLDGSRQSVPAIPVRSATGGFVTILEVTDDDLGGIIDQYYDQISGQDVWQDQTFEYEGATMRYVSCDCGGGGGTFTISATQRPSEPAYLLIERYTD